MSRFNTLAYGEPEDVLNLLDYPLEEKEVRAVLRGLIRSLQGAEKSLLEGEVTIASLQRRVRALETICGVLGP